MATSIIETTRLLHAELEQQQRKAAEELVEDAKTVAERVGQEFRAEKRVEKMVEISKKLFELYQDADGVRREELAAISGEQVFPSFYDRVKNIRDFHRKPPVEAKLGELDVDVLEKPRFTDEEKGGTHLDMVIFYDRYVNMKQLFERSDYITFLSKLDKLHLIPKEKKLSFANVNAYKQFMEDVAAYLIDFFRRTNPTVPVDKMLAMIEESFEKRWANKKIAAWFNNNEEKITVKKEDSKEAKEEKTEKKDSTPVDENSPLYCKYCKRMFAKDTVFEAHLKGRPHKRALQQAAAGIEAQDKEQKLEALSKEIAFTEEKIIRFVEILRDTVVTTMQFMEKKQTRTIAEIEAERQRRLAVEYDDTDSDDDDKPIYNPLNLPLGWDGKPIPYWLYKLHGLNIEYTCEICGGYSYFGPRAFERHFREWRHEYGLRCLGIKNSIEFLNVTRMDDALALWDKLQKTEVNVFKPDEDEEYEDREGKVYSKKTFEELRRQGVI